MYIFSTQFILLQSHIISSKITKLERDFISLELSFQLYCHFCFVCIHVCMLFIWVILMVKSNYWPGILKTKLFMPNLGNSYWTNYFYMSKTYLRSLTRFDQLLFPLITPSIKLSSGGSMVRAFAPWAGGRGFDSQPRHTKYVKNQVFPCLALTI